MIFHRHLIAIIYFTFDGALRITRTVYNIVYENVWLKMYTHLGLLQFYAIPWKPQVFATHPKMASKHVFATVGTTKFDLFISSLSSQNTLNVSVWYTFLKIMDAKVNFKSEYNVLLCHNCHATISQLIIFCMHSIT